MPFQRVVESLALDGEGAGVVIRFAVDEEDRLFDLIGVIKRRHFAPLRAIPAANRSV